ncbi:hypothetical protein D1631_05825 [Chryseobacterium nematophagum]|uniref:Uncharacterized protein n=1 Tax=Chryseobacterium nematophagum TaxID=2305228 RepID=A0A3M7TEI6_9FLAO|nr:hypothetical protein [Chryseobacterium nematophagum]RNA61484.1 hypothetical protein D1631_05825 [Chryseobacterium nematophagum]
MKKFLNEVFKPYLFPVVLSFLAVFFRESLDFEPIKEFFSSSSSSFLKFFSVELYLWQIIIYGIAIYLILKMYSLIFESRSKKERKMLRAIRRAPKEHRAFFENKSIFILNTP